MRLDVIDSLLHGRDLLGFLVRNLGLELLLEGHDELDGVERVGAQVLDEGRILGDFVLVDSELLALNKRVLNLGLELMGARTLQRLATELDAVGHRTAGALVRGTALRIAQLIFGAGFAGAERHALELCNALATRHAVFLTYVRRAGGSVLESAIKAKLGPAVTPIGLPRRWPGPALWRTVRRLRLDLVHSHDERASRYAARWAPGSRKVATLHLGYAPRAHAACDGLVCLTGGAETLDATWAQLDATGFRVDDTNLTAWAHAQRAAHGWCTARGWTTGFLNGHQSAGNYGVTCQE